MSERRRLMAGASWTLISTVGALVAGTLLRPVLVLYVGVEGYGNWASAVAVASLLGIGGDLGVSGALTKRISERQARKEEPGTIAGSALIFSVCMGSGAGIILALSSVRLEQYLAFPAFATLLQIQALQMPFYFATASLLSLLQGRREFRTAAIIALVQSVGGLLLTLLLLVLGFGLVGLVSSSLIISILIFLALLVLQRKDLGFHGLPAVISDWKVLVPFGLHLTATTALSTVLYQADIVVLSVLSTDLRIVGTYALAVFATRVLWIVPGTISVTTYPVISEYSAAQDGRRIEKYLSTALAASVAITGALATGLALFGRPLLYFVFGPESVPAYGICLLLLLGTAPLGSLRSIASSLPGVGRPDIGMWISGLGAVSILTLALALTTTLGATGAALAVSISFAIITATLVWAINRYVVAPSRVRWDAKRIALTAGVSTIVATLAYFGSLPEIVETPTVVLALLGWIGGVILLGFVSGGKKVWGEILRLVKFPALGRA